MEFITGGRSVRAGTEPGGRDCVHRAVCADELHDLSVDELASLKATLDCAR